MRCAISTTACHCCRPPIIQMPCDRTPHRHDANYFGAIIDGNAPFPALWGQMMPVTLTHEGTCLIKINGLQAKFRHRLALSLLPHHSAVDTGHPVMARFTGLIGRFRQGNPVLQGRLAAAEIRPQAPRVLLLTERYEGILLRLGEGVGGHEALSREAMSAWASGSVCVVQP